MLTGEEIQRLLIQPKRTGVMELLLLELSTGLRRGEILALQWDDLDFRTERCGWSGRCSGSKESW